MDRGRIFRFARFLAGVLACFVSLSAYAVDTSTCGFLKCEGYRASTAPFNAGCAAYTFCEYQGLPNSGNVERVVLRVKNRPPSGSGCSQGNGDWQYFPLCNCATQPQKPAGTMFGTNSGKVCESGCLFTPVGGSVCTPWEIDPATGGPKSNKWTCAAEGWSALGENCNPLHPDAPLQPSPPKVCKGTQVGEICLEPLVPPPPAPPEICASYNGDQLGCAGQGDPCKVSPKGALCVGNPPPEPPPPENPPGSPSGTPPPQWPPPIVVPGESGPPQACITMADGSVHCIEVKVHPKPEPSPEPPKCPDGSSPSADGTCAAPPGQCPGGTAPVNGRCPAPDGGGGPGQLGNCPDGSTPQNGVCYGNCPDGSRPVNGTCAAAPGTCPNGAQPVNGRCSLGSPCNPATDLDHCEGNNGGNAGGGGTCAAAPFCSGDVIACAALNQTWRTRCGVEKLTSAITNTDGLPTEGDIGITDPSEVISEGGDLGSMLDTSSWLSGSCPLFPVYEVMGVRIDLNNGAWCTTLNWLGYLVFAGATITSAKILAG